MTRLNRPTKDSLEAERRKRGDSWTTSRDWTQLTHCLHHLRYYLASSALPVNRDTLEVIPSPSPFPRTPSLPPELLHLLLELLHLLELRHPFSDALTERIFTDTPPLIPDIICHLNLVFFQNSVSDELHEQHGVPRRNPPPRSYFRIQESDSFESLIRQFSRITEPIPERIFTIEPHYFDSQEIRNTGQPPRSCIPDYHRPEKPGKSRKVREIEIGQTKSGRHDVALSMA
ncbi:hypothetical protein G5I_08443 [Acromyrmex echinatior]|uniref:Uncharacterized protein n=1 Tax=Acromyrmex echinatior TaxID=103372 RepID=F4WRJ2_ACREC|nr:hypothetical protein G5I_08443 [Acromyrmex echinatior]